MPGRYRDSHPWPFYALRITTPRLELRVPDDEDIVELVAAAQAGIHPAGEMPFGVPWTDWLHEPEALHRFSSFYWASRGSITPEKWSLPFAVVSDGAIVGTQELLAEDFAGARSVSSGSWLTASAQGRGLGALEAQTSTWVDNRASQRVSLRLGYLHEGQQLLARRGEPTAHLRYRLTREAWQQNRFDGIEIHHLEPCLPFLSAA